MSSESASVQEEIQRLLSRSATLRTSSQRGSLSQRSPAAVGRLSDEMREMMYEGMRRGLKPDHVGTVESRIRQGLFDKQLDFIYDPSRRKAALCGRRSGKTYASARYLLLEAFRRDGVIGLYVGINRRTARRILWDELKRAVRDLGLEAEYNNSELEARFPNNSQIWLTGASDSTDIEKFRGQKYAIAVLDECGSFGSFLGELIDDVLEPAMLDLDGTIAMVGTPTAACAGKFYEVTESRRGAWSTHKWTVLDNPHIPMAAGWLENKRVNEGWDASDPTYRREWRGEWCRGTDDLVYKFKESLNTYEALPEGQWDYALGVDLGFDDPTAFVITAYSEDSPCVYVVDAIRRGHMIPSEIGEMVQQLNSRYQFTTMVVDTGGLGKSISEELKARFGLPIKPAEKTAKLTHIELVNGDLLKGLIKIKPNTPLAEEWGTLQWEDNKRKEDGRFNNHCSDAFLYSFRDMTHYRYEKPVQNPEAGSDEWYREQEQEYIERAEERIRSKLDSEWWESPDEEYYV